MENVKLPFNEEKLSDNTFIRTFYQDVDSGDLYWHRDFEDRIIEPLEENDWKFQLDNELPIDIKGEIFIPKGIYHRIIKGSGNLKIKLKKL